MKVRAHIQYCGVLAQKHPSLKVNTGDEFLPRATSCEKKTPSNQAYNAKYVRKKVEKAIAQ